MGKVAHLRSADSMLGPAVAETIQSLPLETQDTAAATLAEQYAAAIDNRGCAECASKHDALAELGPKLLACLVELGATPRSRAAAGKGGAAGGGKLAQLRAARPA